MKAFVVTQVTWRKPFFFAFAKLSFFRTRKISIFLMSMDLMKVCFDFEGIVLIWKKVLISSAIKANLVTYLSIFGCSVRKKWRFQVLAKKTSPTLTPCSGWTDQLNTEGLISLFCLIGCLFGIFLVVTYCFLSYLIYINICKRENFFDWQKDKLQVRHSTWAERHRKRPWFNKGNIFTFISYMGTRFGGSIDYDDYEDDSGGKKRGKPPVFLGGWQGRYSSLPEVADYQETPVVQKLWMSDSPPRKIWLSSRQCPIIVGLSYSQWSCHETLTLQKISFSAMWLFEHCGKSFKQTYLAK